MDNNSFFTFSDYFKNNEQFLTPSMEDYMEMIYRLCLDNGFTRVNDLSEHLNVQPPSTSKMIQRLAQLNLIKYERYGAIILTETGRHIGSILLERHNTIEQFLTLIGVTKANVLVETEKIEHTISNDTFLCFKKIISFFENNDDLKIKYDLYNNEK